MHVKQSLKQTLEIIYTEAMLRLLSMLPHRSNGKKKRNSVARESFVFFTLLTYNLFKMNEKICPNYWELLRCSSSLMISWTTCFLLRIFLHFQFEISKEMKIFIRKKKDPSFNQKPTTMNHLVDAMIDFVIRNQLKSQTHAFDCKLLREYLLNSKKLDDKLTTQSNRYG